MTAKEDSLTTKDSKEEMRLPSLQIALGSRGSLLRALLVALCLVSLVCVLTFNGGTPSSPAWSNESQRNREEGRVKREFLHGQRRLEESAVEQCSVFNNTELIEMCLSSDDPIGSEAHQTLHAMALSRQQVREGVSDSEAKQDTCAASANGSEGEVGTDLH